MMNANVYLQKRGELVAGFNLAPQMLRGAAGRSRATAIH